jgi:hypothetical protein
VLVDVLENIRPNKTTSWNTYHRKRARRQKLTIPEHIMQGVAVLVMEQNKNVFSREEIREVLNVDREIWNASYNPTFQGMRSDQPGGAPNVGEKYKNVFRQIEHGKHKLTDYGKQLLEEFGG